jgi:RimJ/RimL family protein N-acetyltransferase
MAAPERLRWQGSRLRPVPGYGRRVLQDHDAAFDYAGRLLVGDRVRLRGTREADLPTLAGWLMDPGIRSTQSNIVLPLSEAAARELLAGWSKNDSTEIGLSIEALDGERLVGHVGLFGGSLKDRRRTLGIYIGRPFLDRGYGTDAVRLAVDYGFREIGLHRIELSVLAFNARAIAVYRKAGFTEEGRAREAVYHDGHWYDEVSMAILDHEWRS